MVSLLLPVIYLAFISLGLPDSLLGSAWPVMYQELGTSVSSAGIISMIIAAGTIVSSLNSDRLNTRFGTGKITAVSVLTTAPGALRFHCALPGGHTAVSGTGARCRFPRFPDSGTPYRPPAFPAVPDSDPVQFPSFFPLLVFALP